MHLKKIDFSIYTSYAHGVFGNTITRSQFFNGEIQIVQSDFQIHHVRNWCKLKSQIFKCMYQIISLKSLKLN